MERTQVVAATKVLLYSNLKPKDCPLAIIKLIGARRHAYEAHSNYPTCYQKLLLIDVIKNDCRSMLNEHPANICKWVKKTEHVLFALMPTETSKLKQSYFEKVKSIVAVVDEFLAKKNS